jgi:hypothetical protein
MPMTIEARMQMIGTIAENHAEEARPTVEAWARRAKNLTGFMHGNAPATLSPITAFVCSERMWRWPS